MRKFAGNMYRDGTLPKFINLDELLTCLKKRGLPWDRADILALVESRQMPCLYLDGDLSRPFFMIGDVVEWIKHERLWVQDGAKMQIKVLALPDSPLAENVPAELATVENLKELRANEQLPCVYFLLRGRVVVYVGQSVQLLRRIISHQADKEFDRVLFIVVPATQLSEIERKFIKLLKPEYNVMHNKSDIELTP